MKCSPTLCFIGSTASLVKYQSLSFCTVQTWNQGHFVENRLFLPRNDFQKENSIPLVSYIRVIVRQLVKQDLC